MHRFPVVWGALIVLLALLAPAFAAEEEIVRVETEIREVATHRANPQDPTDRLAKPQAQSMALVPTPPAGTGRVPEGRTRHYGVLDAGGRQVPLVLARREGTDAVLALDANGDGSLGGAGAEFAATGRAGKKQGRPVVRWTFSAVPVGEARVDVAVHDTAPTYQAVLVKEAPSPIALTDGPRAGTRLFDAGTQAVAHGEAEGLALAFVRGRGSRLTLLLDKNQNGVVGESGEVLPMPVAGQDGATTYWQVEGVPLPSGAAGLAFQEIPGEVTAFVRPNGARRGRVQIAGRNHHLHVLDADLDGRYGSSGDLWWFGPSEHLAQLRRLVPDAMVEAGEPAFVDGRGWRLVSVDGNGGAVLMVDPNAGGVEAYFHRRAERVNRERWWPVFQAEEATFRQDQGIDPSRPRATSLPHWHHDVDLRHAMELAQRENKPILADFEADWCSWCKRFDYYVYVDREVAELLERFVLVKINKEFHFSGEFDRLGGKGLPFLVFLRPDGTPIQMTLPDGHGGTKTCAGPPGFQPPATFAQTLRTALAAYGR